jgi:hypothetical protein
MLANKHMQVRVDRRGGGSRAAGAVVVAGHGPGGAGGAPEAVEEGHRAVAGLEGARGLIDFSMWEISIGWAIGEGEGEGGGERERERERESLFWAIGRSFVGAALCFFLAWKYILLFKKRTDRHNTENRVFDERVCRRHSDDAAFFALTLVVQQYDVAIVCVTTTATSMAQHNQQSKPARSRDRRSAHHEPLCIRSQLRGRSRAPTPPLI